MNQREPYDRLRCIDDDVTVGMRDQAAIERVRSDPDPPTIQRTPSLQLPMILFQYVHHNVAFRGFILQRQ